MDRLANCRLLPVPCPLFLLYVYSSPLQTQGRLPARSTKLPGSCRRTFEKEYDYANATCTTFCASKQNQGGLVHPTIANETCHGVQNPFRVHFFKGAEGVDACSCSVAVFDGTLFGREEGTGGTKCYDSDKQNFLCMYRIVEGNKHKVFRNRGTHRHGVVIPCRQSPPYLGTLCSHCPVGSHSVPRPLFRGFCSSFLHCPFTVRPTMSVHQHIHPEGVKIIIVGAGICGLMTAIQLERAGMDYVVFEKAKECLPLGSALSLTPACNYIFDQLGMLEDIQKVSLPCQKIDYVREDLSKVGTMDAGNNKERYGYNGILITRPAFYDILLSRVPAHKIKWGKRILGMEQNQYGVMIRVADNSTHHADILIGADGAYSAVRQTLYKSMLKKGLTVPKSDMAPLHFNSNCVIGVTDVLSEEEFPVLKDRTGDFHVIIGKERSIQVYLFTFAESRIGWQICGKMECPEDHDEQNFRFSDWGPVAADDLCDQVRHYQCPFGGTLGDLMDRTPKERLSKVMLEDKYFHTWWHLRTVLMGDACHKHLPFGGQGANQAILDSVHLVNQLYAIPSGSLEDIAKSFKAYHANRSPNARGVYKSTGMVANVLGSRGLGSDTLRSLALSKTPKWLNDLGMDGMNSERPVLCFLPPPNVQPTVKGKPQAVPVHYKQVLKANGIRGASSIFSSASE